jgi:hypothetical protein
LYQLTLALYPADYRVRFGTEMLATFTQAEANQPLGGRRVFVACEMVGLLSGLVAEWTDKWMSDPASRGRHLPDCRKMRPVGVRPDEWARGL